MQIQKDKHYVMSTTYYTTNSDFVVFPDRKQSSFTHQNQMGPDQLATSTWKMIQPKELNPWISQVNEMKDWKTERLIDA